MNLEATAARPRLEHWLPSLRTIRAYRRSWLGHDLVAGLVVATLLVPAGMGYAEAAGLPRRHRPVRHDRPASRLRNRGTVADRDPRAGLVAGPTDRGDDPAARRGQHQPSDGIGRNARRPAGLLCILAGLARFGYLTDLLSVPVRYGYLNGIALLIFVTQLPKLCGFSTDADGVIEGVEQFVRGLADGAANRTALLLGVGALAMILAARRWAPVVPGPLVAVVAAIASVAILGLADEGISLVGELPQGLPAFELPDVRLDDLGPLLAGAAGIAVVSFADTSVLSRTFAMRGGYEVDPNRSSSHWAWPTAPPACSRGSR